MDKSAMLNVKNLRTWYFTPLGIVKAVNDVSFELESGEILGIVGESGSGKTTLGRSILRVVPEPGKIIGGQVLFEGTDLLQLSDAEITAIRGKKLSIIPETPILSLNPAFTIEDQIKDALKFHLGYSDKDAKKEAFQLLSEVAIPDRQAVLRAYPHQLSGGMCQRVLIAMAFSCKPSLVIADEPTTSVDVITQVQIIRLIKKMQNEYKSSLIFITHDMGLASKICIRMAVLYAGKLLEMAPTERMLKSPMHPYTKALVRVASSIRTSRIKRGYLYGIEGSLPSLIRPPRGCIFEPRCEKKLETCRELEDVQMIEVEKGHFVACVLYM